MVKNINLKSPETPLCTPCLNLPYILDCAQSSEDASVKCVSMSFLSLAYAHPTSQHLASVNPLG